MTEDPDDHPEVVRQTVLMVHERIAIELRKSARIVSTRPHVTAQQALLDAADSVDRSAAAFIAQTRQ